MKLYVVFVIFAVLSVVVYGQNDGRYRPTPRPSIFSNLPSIFSNELRPGQYRPNVGRYRPDNSGRYSNNDGKYRPSDDGKYRPDDSGKYDGTYDKYKHQDVGGGQYQGSKDVIQPYRDLQVPYGSNNGGQSNNAQKAPSAKPPQPLNIVKTSGPSIGEINRQYADGNGLSTLGLPSGLEQGNAAGLYDNRNYRIIVDEKESNNDGSYRYKYETENKIFAEETGKQVGSGDQIGAASTGYYRYTGPDNIVYTVNYHAGPEGFVAEGAHIPTPPPIPDLILRALEYQRKVGVL